MDVLSLVLGAIGGGLLNAISGVFLEDPLRSLRNWVFSVRKETVETDPHGLVDSITKHTMERDKLVEDLRMSDETLEKAKKKIAEAQGS